jgi:RimJ/RimL family protein N-acetyltransferase
MCSEDIVLRPWTAADRGSISSIVGASKKEFHDWLPMLVPSLDDFDAFVVAAASDADHGIGWTYAVEVHDVVVGQCSVHLREDSCAELGYWVRSDRTGEGIATRAVRLLCQYAERSFSTVVIRCDEGNVRSAAVARAAGFIHVGAVDLDSTIMGTEAQTGREMTWRLESAL